MYINHPISHHLQSSPHKPWLKNWIILWEALHVTRDYIFHPSVQLSGAFLPLLSSGARRCNSCCCCSMVQPVTIDDLSQIPAESDDKPVSLTPEIG